MPSLPKAPSEISPLAINIHPLHYGEGILLRKEMARATSPIGSAKPGDPVGFSLAISQAGGIPFQVDEVCVLFAQDPGMDLRDVRVSLLVGKPEFEPLVRIALRLAPLIGDFQGPDMAALRFAPSPGRSDGYVMRTLWLFPDTALLIDDLQYVTIRAPEDLRYLAIGYYSQPKSHHELFARCNEIDKVFACATQQITICYDKFLLDHDGEDDYEMTFAPVDRGELRLALETPGAQ